ncbi:hypothetical protein [Tianweitania sediminis]|uniref:Uncharacterized protein n=1 Tax=Tianweitania sediminis TaxID=1502156 RepID=A0A8J7R0V1_9HYPH|nr:hypothetical protein [Tianweitania sediminis]MBP0438016.1 hypothetical protein [Tianweitania sediminis]
MSESFHIVKLNAWLNGTVPESEIAEVLGLDVPTVHRLKEACHQASASRHSPNTRSSRDCIRLAIANALHAHAGLSLQEAAEVAASSWQISSSVSKVIDFEPPPFGANDTRLNSSLGGCDPFMFMAAHATEAIPVPAIDEYIEIADGKRIYWRRPVQEAHQLGCDILRLSHVSRCEDVPALQEQYLEVLSRLRQPAEHVCEWIGSLSGGHFRPAPDRFAERSPGMLQGPLSGTVRTPHADVFGSKVSINVSLAARSMKRRVLGLAVTGVPPTKPPALFAGTRSLC